MKKEIINVAEKAIINAVEKELVGYNKPLSKFVNEVLESHKSDFLKIIDDEITAILNAESFRGALSEALNYKMARLLVSNLGGELEKQVNALKANPETRAKITIAISKVIQEIK